MVSALVLACGLFAAFPDNPTPSPEDFKAYQEAKAHAKRDPDAHIRLALWCEAHGLNAERLKHLAIAVLVDPKNTTARGLLGLVAYNGQWRRPEDVAEKVRADADMAAKLAEYNAKRDKLTNTADAHWKLALWCEENGLQAETKAHLATVVRLDPKREEGWKRLGYKKHNGHWMTLEQISAQKAEIEAQQKADRQWRDRLEKWKGWLGQKDAKRSDAEAVLAGVTDPRAVRAVWQVFALGGQADQTRAVQLMGQIDAPMASRALALLSVFSPSAEVRRQSVETLKRRDPRDFVGLLISLLHKPLKYDVRPVNGPGSQGVLFVEGEQYNVRRAYNAPGLPALTMQLIFERMNSVLDLNAFPGAGGPRIVVNPDGFGATDPRLLPGLQRAATNPADLASFLGAAANARQPAQNEAMTEAFGIVAANSNMPAALASIKARQDSQILLNVSEARRAAVAAAQQLESDVASIKAYNANVNQANEQTLFALNIVTGQDFGSDQQGWTAWWTDQRGYAYQPPPERPKPTFDQVAPLAYTPSYMQSHNACFASGTPVRTLDGSQPIEALKIGDQILTQDTQTGALSYQPILAVFHNRPAATMKIQLGDETIVATGIHRFWKTGKGWTMARDLKEGDAIRTVGGLMKVAAVESDIVRPVFNLEVGANQSFFVGNQGVLVHDNSLVKPVLQPFDAEPTLTVAK
ncbi:MAG TPA: polymorphic toxin-type HINT domain-containing protein [Isosphaeraceae bacterium]|jgi:hypothetical protein|nr:polymorphic toxin-type HINT domain-containing protein [Isosphaeraceae bacterium]